MAGIIERTLQPLVPELDTLREEGDALDAKLKEKRGEQRRVEKILRDAGLIEKPEPSPSAKQNGKPKSYADGPSAETIERTRDALTEIEGPFTTKALAELMGSAEMTAKKGIEALRETGEVRLIGARVPEGNDAQIKAMHYEARS